MNPFRQITRLKGLLDQARGDRLHAREELRHARSREKALRTENARLRHRLLDFGVRPRAARRAGYGTVDDACRARMCELKAEGKNNSQIGRLLGFSPATVSLVVRGKYPSGAKKRAEPRVGG